MIYNRRKKYSPRLTAAVICFCVFSSLSSQAAYAQYFSSIDNDLQTLGGEQIKTLTLFYFIFFRGIKLYGFL